MSAFAPGYPDTARPRILAGWTCTLAAGILAAFTAGATGQAVLTTLEAEELRGEVRRITAEGEVELADRTMGLFDLRRIDRSVEVRTPPLKATRVFLIDGSRLIAENLTVADDRVQFDWAYGESVDLPVEAVRGVTLSPLSNREGRLQPEPEFADTLTAERDGEDTLFVKNEDGIVSVNGILETLTSEQVEFVWNEESRRLERGRVYGLTLALVAQPPESDGRVTVELADGSRLTGAVTRLVDGELALELVGDASVALPWSDVAKMIVHSPRLRFLSDMEPRDVRQDGWPTYAWPPRMDQTVMGGPIQLDGEVYERGIGVIAYTRLRYEIDGGYDAFAAVIGIDDDAEGRGDCVFVVEGDGRELLRQRQRGDEPPTPITVEVTGVEELTLTVEKGEGLNLGDHADWADARLLRDP